jgi:hypothetical protein
MPVERKVVVTRADREAAFMACGGFVEMMAESEWVVNGKEAGFRHRDDDVAIAIATARQEGEARGFEAGKKAAVDVLRSHCLFDRKYQAEQKKLADAGDMNARGRAYEHELRADYLQELIDECEDAGVAGGEGSE